MYIIGGKYKKQALIAPKGSQTRPTASRLRETIFNICQQEVEDSLFLDIFAGSGAIGLEALSRGAKHVVFIENSRNALHALRQNIAHLKVEKQTTIFFTEVEMALKALIKEKFVFDLIYADPPYAAGYGLKIFEFFDHNPVLLAPQGRLFIEDTPYTQPECTCLTLKKEKRAGRAILREYAHL